MYTRCNLTSKLDDLGDRRLILIAFDRIDSRSTLSVCTMENSLDALGYAVATMPSTSGVRDPLRWVDSSRDTQARGAKYLRRMNE